MLASEYYEVAGEEPRRKLTRGKQQQLSMQRCSPSMDGARKQAEEMRKQFGDPDRRSRRCASQAEAARKSLQQQQQGAKKANRKSADELEKELRL